MITTEKRWQARYDQGVELGRVIGRIEVPPLAAVAGEPDTWINRAPRPRRPHPHLRLVTERAAE